MWCRIVYDTSLFCVNSVPCHIHVVSGIIASICSFLALVEHILALIVPPCSFILLVFVVCNLFNGFISLQIFVSPVQTMDTVLKAAGSVFLATKCVGGYALKTVKLIKQPRNSCALKQPYPYFDLMTYCFRQY